MGKRFYRIAVPLIRLFIPRLEIRWEIPFDEEPCVFVANHERAIGPLEMAVNFPLREESPIWIYAAPLDRKTTPDYVRQDHWWKENGKLAPLWNAVIPPVVSLILPPILRSAPHVPVYHDGRAATTMKESLRLLRAAFYPGRYRDHQCPDRHFLTFSQSQKYQRKADCCQPFPFETQELI